MWELSNCNERVASLHKQAIYSHVSSQVELQALYNRHTINAVVTVGIIVAVVVKQEKEVGEKISM